MRRVYAAMKRSGLEVIVPELIPEFTRTKASEIEGNRDEERERKLSTVCCFSLKKGGGMYISELLPVRNGARFYYKLALYLKI